jgi:hypothetical protein
MKREMKGLLDLLGWLKVDVKRKMALKVVLAEWEEYSSVEAEERTWDWRRDWEEGAEEAEQKSWEEEALEVLRRLGGLGASEIQSVSFRQWRSVMHSVWE